jgi:hypothetical protein
MLRAKVTLGDDFPVPISYQYSIGAGYYAGPAPNALIWINGDYSGYRIPVHGAGEAGIDTPGLSAVTTLNGEANVPLPLHVDAR